jgi:hypothetical protein
MAQEVYQQALASHQSARMVVSRAMWFPFALGASLFMLMASGSKSGWRTSADMAEEERRRREDALRWPSTPPKVQGVWPFSTV